MNKLFRRGLCALALSALVTGTCVADPLHRSGPPSERLDLVIVSDGFKARDRDQFDRAARDVLEHLERTEPFSAYMGLMNVHSVFHASPSSGAGKNNRYGTHFPKGFFSTTLRVTRMTELLRDAVREAGEADVVLVIVKSNRRGGTATGHVCYVSNGAGKRVAIHELGHALGRLGDEYSGSSGTPYLTREQAAARYANLTLAKRRQDLPWRAWVKDSTRVPGNFFTGGVSAFEGGGVYSRGVYRPRRSCRMRTDGPGFCEVCREQLVLKLHEGSTPIRLRIEGSGSGRRAKLISALPADRWAVRWSGVSAQGLEANVPAGVQASVVVEDKTGWVRGDLRSGVRYRFNVQSGQGGRVGSGGGQIGTVVGVTSRLRIRSGPSTSSSIVGHLLPNAQVEVVGPPVSGFYPIAHAGGVAYVGASFVRLPTSSAGLLGPLGR